MFLIDYLWEIFLVSYEENHDDDIQGADVTTAPKRFLSMLNGGEKYDIPLPKPIEEIKAEMDAADMAKAEDEYRRIVNGPMEYAGNRMYPQLARAFKRRDRESFEKIKQIGIDIYNGWDDHHTTPAERDELLKDAGVYFED